jgi:hypothetical protein
MIRCCRLSAAVLFTGLSIGATLAVEPPTPTEQWNDLIKKLATDAAYRRKDIADCVEATNKDAKRLETTIVLTSLPRDRAARVVCERISRAIISGRLTLDMLLKMRAGHRFPDFVRIIQGR